MALKLRPVAARGTIELEETAPQADPAPILAVTGMSGTGGEVSLPLRLFYREEEPEAALLLPSYRDAAGQAIEPPYPGFEASDSCPAFRYLAAGPEGVLQDLVLEAPAGAVSGRFLIVPAKAGPAGLRAEAGEVAKEAQHLDGVPLPAEGLVLERKLGKAKRIRFKLRVVGARDLAVAGHCAVTYLDAAGEALPLPYPGLSDDPQHGAVLSFGASRKPQGRATQISLDLPPEAATAVLRFLPRKADDALLLRVEPMRSRGSILAYGK